MVPEVTVTEAGATAVTTQVEVTTPTTTTLQITWLFSSTTSFILDPRGAGRDVVSVC